MARRFWDRAPDRAPAPSTELLIQAPEDQREGGPQRDPTPNARTTLVDQSSYPLTGTPEVSVGDARGPTGADWSGALQQRQDFNVSCGKRDRTLTFETNPSKISVATQNGDDLQGPVVEPIKCVTPIYSSHQHHHRTPVLRVTEQGS